MMMACDAMDMAVAGEDLQLMAMENSAAGGDTGGEGGFMFAGVQMGPGEGAGVGGHPQWTRDEMQGAGGDVGDGAYAAQIISEERSRVGRHPRWTRDETLILIEGKRVEEAKWSKVKENRERGIEIGRANSDSKWLSISQFCERMGASRSAAQCRKRWCNLSADYKRIRDWETLRGKQSFWLMSNDVRKENKLPGCFDREVFDALNKSLGVHACSAPDMIFDSGRQGADDGLFSDIEHPLVEENLSVSADKEIDSPAIESLTSAQGPPVRISCDAWKCATKGVYTPVAKLEQQGCAYIWRPEGCFSLAPQKLGAQYAGQLKLAAEELFSPPKDRKLDFTLSSDYCNQ